MRRLLMPARYALLLMVAGVLLAGCDESPSSVNDFEIQSAVQVPQGLTVIVAGREGGSTDFELQYQGLDAAPTLASSSDALVLERIEETGTPEDGTQHWRATYDGALSGVAEETITAHFSGGGREIVRAIPVTAAAISIQTDFSSTLAVAADYEDPQRDSSITGGASLSTTSDVSPSSNGLTALQVDASASGGVTITRQASAPQSDRFTFLLKPDPDTDFTLTLSFTEAVDGSEVTRAFEVPVSAGTQWRRYGIPFDQIGEGLDPVAARAGGSGAFLRLDLTADADVTYAIDQLAFGTEGQSRVEIEDFERTSLAYGPPFCPPTFGASDQVADQSDGFNARSVSGTPGCFGYNYQADGGPALFLDATDSGSLSFLARGSAGDSLNVFVETAGGAGGFSGGHSVTVALPVGDWEQVRIPLTDLGDDVSALRSAGITNVGFNSAGEDPDFLIDDLKLLAGE